MEKICNIIGAGDFFEKEIPLSPNDIIIGADGGVKAIEKIGITPDYIIGDFDSLKYTPKGENVIALPCEKDITDTRACISKGLELGFKRFRIYGGTGGREEHTLANIQSLAWLTKMGCRGEIIDKDKVITAISKGKIEFEKGRGGFVSVFSHTNKAKGVCEKGLKYTLSNATLTNREPLGVSNEFTGERAEISVKKGILIIIYDR